MMRSITTYIRYLLPLWIGMMTYGFSWAQSGTFGNTFIHSGGEMVIFGAQDFQNGGSGVLPGMVGTERQPVLGVLSFVPGSSWSNASATQHVDGYVRSYLGGRFIFPIGDNGQYYPAAVSGATAAQPATAAYYAVNPSLAITSILGGGNYPVLPPGGPFPTTSMGPGVTVVDTTGYWDIDGATPANITLTWDAAKNISSFTASVSSVKIVGWNGTEWVLVPSAVDVNSILGVPSTLVQGSVTSTSPLAPSSYTVYALAIGCLADTVPPVVSEDTLFIFCPNTTADLSVITATGLPAGTVLSFHSDSIASVSNELDSTIVGPGIYYAADKDTANLCYGPTTPIYVILGADTIAPVIAGCPTDIAVNNDPATCGATVTWIAPTATDNCNGPVTTTASHNPGDVFPVGITAVTYIFADSSGNADTCTFTVTVADTEAPEFAGCPTNISISNDLGNCSAAATWTVPTATDNCGGTVTITSTHNPGDVFPVGVTTVTYTATDSTGNDTTCTFTVTVTDTEAPTFAGCPTDISISNDLGNCSAVATWAAPTATDNCAGTVTVTSTHNPGDVFPVGVTTVTYTATDSTGNDTTCTFTVTVNDTEAPIFAGCPTDITMANNTGDCSARVIWTAPTATDNCAGTVTITSTHNSGDIFPVGVTTVTYTATDSAGNVDSCSFNISVNDTEAPTFAGCPTNISISNDLGNCSAVATWTAPTATDNCAGTVTVTSTHNPGDVFPVGVTTVTYTATDSTGNDTTCTFTVTVTDTEAPTFAGCPTDISISNDLSNCSAVATWTAPTATDNCAGTVTSTHDPGDVFPVGVTTVTYTATDSSGNDTTCTFTVTVTDTEAPVFAGCPTDITLSNDLGSCSATATWTVPTAMDNCAGTVTVTSTHNPGDVFPVGITTVTYMATDSAGNVDSCSFNITVTDTETPVFAGCPTDITLSNDAGNCSAVATWTAPTATDNCAGTVTSTHNPGDVFPVGVTTVTYTATDSSGNDTTCTFTVTVNDTEAPALVCPSDITVDHMINTCYRQVYFPDIVATDNCTAGTVTVTTDYPSGYLFPVGTTVVTVNATDALGNDTTCTFNVTVNDVQAPQINLCPANITLDADAGQCSAVATWIEPTVFDNCPGASLTSNFNSGAVFPVGTTTVTYIALDSAGLSDTCTFTVTVVDKQLPTIVGCPTNINLSADAGQCTAVATWTVPTATDNCSSVTLVSSHNSGDVFPAGTTTVTYTATDSAGNASICTFTVTVADTEAPVMAGCPTDISMNNDAGQCGAIVTWTPPTATDNCSATVTVTASHNPGDLFPIGVTTVTYLFTDSAGNADTCTFNVTVTDTEMPVATGCPTDIVVGNDFNACGAVVNWTAPVFTDNCPGVTVTASHVSGTTFPIGTTTITYTATDAAGNDTTCTFTVTVNDTQLPVVNGCPANISVNNTAGQCGATVTWTAPTAFDNCPGVTLTSSFTSGATFPVGTSTVTYTATDSAGNVDSCSFTVTVTDTEAPVMTACPANIVVSNDAGQCGAAVTWTAATATDNCGLDSLTSSFNSGDVFPIGTTTVTYTATDSAGNVSTCTFTVTVNDTELPVMAACPTDISVSNDAGTCGAAITWTAPTATDNCAGVVLTSNYASGATFPVGTTTVTYTATDAAGQAATCSFTVTVNDTEAPVVANCPGNIAADAAFSTCGAPVSWTAPTFTDNCAGGLTITASHTPGVEFPVGTTTVTYVATDAAGNVDSCSFDVTVTDTQIPVIVSCPIDVIVNNDPGICGATVNWVHPTALDNCPGVLLTSTSAPNTVFPVGTTTVTYTATDASGNTATCSFTVTVTDKEAPTVAACPTDISVSNDAGLCSATATWTAPTATDNCSGNVTVTASHNPGDVFPVGTTTVTYTFTDSTGNVATCTFDVTVNDTETPVVAGCPGDITSCTNVVSWTAPTATDNCTGVVSVTASHNPGDTFPVGITTVTYLFTDAAGNVDTCSFTVTVSHPILTPVATNVTCNGLADGTATVTVAGAIAPFTFDWGTFGSDSLITGLAPGTYPVTVTDNNGCSDSTAVTITESAVFSVTLEAIKDATCGFANGYVQVLTEGGTPDYSYAWSDGQTTQNLYNVTAGKYTLVAIDANGCPDSLAVNINCSFTDIPQLITPNGDGHNDTWVIPGIDGYPDAVVEIYNRWGNLVYKSSPYLNDWAGYSENVTDVGKGKLPAATYFYVIVLAKGQKALTGYIELQY